jgi:hypothetical protein
MTDPRYDTKDGDYDVECECGWEGTLDVVFHFGPYGPRSKTVVEWTCPECQETHEDED